MIENSKKKVKTTQMQHKSLQKQFKNSQKSVKNALQHDYCKQQNNQKNIIKDKKKI